MSEFIFLTGLLKKHFDREGLFAFFFFFLHDSSRDTLTETDLGFRIDGFGQVASQGKDEALPKKKKKKPSSQHLLQSRYWKPSLKNF